YGGFATAALHGRGRGSRSGARGAAGAGARTAEQRRRPAAIHGTGTALSTAEPSRSPAAARRSAPDGLRTLALNTHAQPTPSSRRLRRPCCSISFATRPVQPV